MAMNPSNKVIWYQPSIPNNDIDGIKWKNVISFPNTGVLLTLTQFLKKCSEVPKSVNDIVFNGMFASQLDYSECAKAIGSLPNLRRLALVNCQTSRFPISPASFWSLTDLAITKCQCFSVPTFLAFVGPNLQYLDLSRNFITELPSQLANRFPRLLELHLTKNQLTDLPKILATMLKLRRLYIGYNQLEILHVNTLIGLQNLHYLDVSYNSNMDSIPMEVMSLPLLKTLNVAGLQGLKTPPYQLAMKGVPEMKRYFADRSKACWLKSRNERY